jgi:hypothetical protein
VYDEHRSKTTIHGPSLISFDILFYTRIKFINYIRINQDRTTSTHMTAILSILTDPVVVTSDKLNPLTPNDL